MAKIMTTGTMQVELIVNDDLLEKISDTSEMHLRQGMSRARLKAEL